LAGSGVSPLTPLSSPSAARGEKEWDCTIRE